MEFDLPSPAVLGAFALLQIGPGIVLQARILPLRAPAETRAAAALLLPWLIHGALALVLGSLGAGPLLPSLLVVALAVVLIFAPRSSRMSLGQWSWDRYSKASIAITSVLLVIVALAPGRHSVISDVYAHVAAVRACVEESRVFPEHEFHAADRGLGTDPRFGTGHAFLASVVYVADSDPLQVWGSHVAISSAAFSLAAAALSTALFATVMARLLCLFAFLGIYAGGVYNVLEVSSYPLWIGWSCALFVLAVTSSSLGAIPRPRLLLWLLLVGAVAMHALAGVLAALALGALGLAGGPARPMRTLHWWLGLAVGSLPFYVLRLWISYGNVNPIHQRPWNVIEWSEGLYSVSPVFLLRWLGPVGVLVLAALVAYPRYSRIRDRPTLRWVLALAVCALGWLLVPYLLTPSLLVLGFLPLRFVMLIWVPVLLAAMLPVHGGEPRRLASRVAIAFVFVVLCTSMLYRVGSLWNSRSGPDLKSGAWGELIDQLNLVEPIDGVLLSDPYTMLLLRATSRHAIVAVPEGRSSPRDPIPVRRLRDTWRAMSPEFDSSHASALLAREEVAFVVLNHTFTAPLYGYEYSIQPETFAAQSAKFLDHNEVFESIWSRDGLTLLRVRDPAGKWAWTTRSECGPTEGTNVPEAPALQLRDGYEVLSPQVTVTDSGTRLRIRGNLRWTGEGQAPDRKLVVRLESAESPVPPAVRAIEKPLRKLLERVRRKSYRVRWTALPGEGSCPLWLLESRPELLLDLDLPIPVRTARGRHRVTLQAADLSEFTVLRWTDLLRDEDVYSGPTIGEVELE